MPPKKQSTRAPPRRSGRHATVMEDDELLPEAEAPAESHISTTTHELAASAPDTINHDNNPDSDIDMQDHPNNSDNPTLEPPAPPSSSSPRPSPRTTPAAAGAAAAPVQRLTSVLPPSSSPIISRSRPQPPSSDPSHQQQQRPPPALKFKPKAVVIRRSKEEREAAEKAERDRLAARFHGATGRESFGRGGRGRAGRGGGRGRGGVGGGAYGSGYGFGGAGGGGGSRGDATASNLRRGREDAVRVASGPLGGATVDGGTKKRGRRWGGSGVEEVVSAEEGGGGDEDDEDVVETGGRKRSGKGKGNGGVKEEAGVKPEGGDKDGDGEGGKKGKRRVKGTAAGGGAGGGKGKGRAKVKKEDDAPTYISSEGEFDSDTAEKINIEAINLVSSEDEEDMELSVMSTVARGKHKEKEISQAVESRRVKNWMNRPVHVERLEHVERTVGVNTDASSLTSADLRRRAKERKGSEGGLFVDEAGPEVSSVARKARRKPRDVEFVRDERKWKGVYIDEDDEGAENDGGVRIKVEPTEEPRPVDMQPFLEKDDEVLGTEDMEVDPVDVDKAVQETAATVSAQNELDGAKALDEEANATRTVPVDEEVVSDDEVGSEVSTDDEDLDDLNLEMTEDDQEEDQSYNLSNCQPEWRTLLDQYKQHKTTELAIATDTEAPSKSAFSGNSEETRAARYHKTYLIQLPPLIPSLRDALTKSSTSKSNKKTKTEPTPASTDPFTVDTTMEETPPPTTSHQHIPNAIHQPAHASDFAWGTAGTLTFYSSGRTLASWGDLSFEVTKEREALGLAQETMMMDYEKVVTKVEDQARWEDVITVGGKEEPEGGGKVVYSGGRVGGGFCVLGA